MNKISTNIKTNYIYKFFMAFDITAAIWILYLSYKGLNLIEIGLLESIFHITGIIFEIPTGAFADLLGRKRTIILGRVAFLISCTIMLLADSFLGFAIAFIIQAFSYNLNSGSEEALLYDTLKQIKSEDKYTKISGRISLIIEISQGLAVFIGGVLAEKSYTLSYIMAILVGLCALAVAFAFREVDVIKENNDVSVIKHFKECKAILKGNKLVIKFLMYYPIVFAISTTTYFYGQRIFSDLGLSKINISIIFLINGAVSAIGALLSERFEKKLSERNYVLIPLSMAGAIIGFAISSGILAMAMFWISSFFVASLYPIAYNKLNGMIPSKQRATILSVDSMVNSLSMIIIFPVVGCIGEYLSLKIGLLIIALIVVMLSLIEIKKRK